MSEDVLRKKSRGALLSESMVPPVAVTLVLFGTFLSGYQVSGWYAVGLSMLLLLLGFSCGWRVQKRIRGKGS